MLDYDKIKVLAQQLGVSVTELLVLANKNDPYYSGQPAQKMYAEWFANLYQQHNLGGVGNIIRRFHYRLDALGVHWPDGTLYENTNEDYERLCEVVKNARILGLVDMNHFVDTRSARAIVPTTEKEETELGIQNHLYYSDLDFPDFPDTPTYYLKGYLPEQRYHLEIWCEKADLNDVLSPLRRMYDMVLQTSKGEISLTNCVQAVQRIKEAGKPTRILYLSDFDPQGHLSMPVAAARKLQWLVERFKVEEDIRLFPVALTLGQIQHYQLPRTPMKKAEVYKRRFEKLFGVGATELDALEALHPGVLRTIVRDVVLRYYDEWLDSSGTMNKHGYEDELGVVGRDVVRSYQDELDALEDEHDELERLFGERFAKYSQAVQELWGRMRLDMEENIPENSMYPVPQGKIAKELDDGLYNSQRSYMEQVKAFKQYQQK